ncbi:MAG: VWA domain-containing protein, partial [Gammaproteobacteria bacterium]
QQDHGTALPANVSVTFKLETDTGVPVPNLPVDSFNLYENDNLISVESARRVTPQDGEFVFSTLLLLDFSGSVVFGSLDTIKSAAASFVENVLPPAATEQTSKSLALAIFDGRQNIVMISDYLTNPDQVKEFIFALDASTAQDPSTNLYGAAIEGIAAISAQVEQQRTLNPDILSAGALVLFTDGTDQAARTTKEAAIQAVEARPEDVSVMTIGLGSEINPQVLQQLGRDAFSQASELNELAETFSEVAQFVSDEADSFYKLDYCSPKRAGMENTLRIQAIQGDLTGELNVVFSAEGFSAGCKI